MRFSNAITDFAPAVLLALVAAIFAAVLTFATVSLLTILFQLGANHMDFAIFWGLALGAVVGIVAFTLTYRKICSSISN
jgi:hypothetical protein